MDNENHKNTWNNFTKFVLWGTVAVISVLVLMAVFLVIDFLNENRICIRKSEHRKKNSYYTRNY